MTSLNAQIASEMASEIMRQIADGILKDNDVLNAQLLESPRAFRSICSLESLRKTKICGRINRETAFINKEGVLIVHYWSKLGHLIAEAWDHIAPTEPQYLELCLKHGLKNVGDRNEIALEWEHGAWKKVA